MLGFTFTEFRLIPASTRVQCCHFSSDGRLLATGGLDKKVWACLLEKLKLSFEILLKHQTIFASNQYMELHCCLKYFSLLWCRLYFGAHRLLLQSLHSKNILKWLQMFVSVQACRGLLHLPLTKLSGFGMLTTLVILFFLLCGSSCIFCKFFIWLCLSCQNKIKNLSIPFNWSKHESDFCSLCLSKFVTRCIFIAMIYGHG